VTLEGVIIVLEVVLEIALLDVIQPHVEAVLQLAVPGHQDVCPGDMRAYGTWSSVRSGRSVSVLDPSGGM
jgi:hypothetical protein